MNYETTTDMLSPTTLFENNNSQLIETIAHKWGISKENALQNIHLRTDIKQTIADHGEHHPELLEAPAVRDANNAFWMLIEHHRLQTQPIDYQQIRKQWMKWFTSYVEKRT